MAPRRKSLQDHINRVRKWNVDAGHLELEDWLYEWIDKPENRELAISLVEEEANEVVEAVERLRDAVERDVMDPDDPWIEAEILKESADVMFTLFGLLAKAGLVDYLEESFEEVCRSNETKLIEPVILPSGKLGKNKKYYEEADIKKILER